MVFAALVKGLPFISMASFHGDAANITWKRFIIQLSPAAINIATASDLHRFRQLDNFWRRVTHSALETVHLPRATQMELSPGPFGRKNVQF